MIEKCIDVFLQCGILYHCCVCLDRMALEDSSRGDLAITRYGCYIMHFHMVMVAAALLREYYEVVCHRRAKICSGSFWHPKRRAGNSSIGRDNCRFPHSCVLYNSRLGSCHYSLTTCPTLENM